MLGLRWTAGGRDDRSQETVFVKHRLLAFLIALLALLARPGASEVVESFAHSVAEGHSARATADLHCDGGPIDIEHGCGGGTHVCPCHAPTVAVQGWTLSEPRHPGDATLLLTGSPDRIACCGVRQAIFRPPTS